MPEMLGASEPPKGLFLRGCEPVGSDSATGASGANAPIKIVGAACTDSGFQLELSLAGHVPLGLQDPSMSLNRARLSRRGERQRPVSAESHRQQVSGEFTWLPATLSIRSGAGAVWKFPLLLIATEPSYDDTITFYSQGLGRPVHVNVMLNSKSSEPAEFIAFLDDNSDADFHLETTSGTLPPASAADENRADFTALRVVFTPSSYGKQKLARLIVQDDNARKKACEEAEVVKLGIRYVSIVDVNVMKNLTYGTATKVMTRDEHGGAGPASLTHSILPFPQQHQVLEGKHVSTVGGCGDIEPSTAPGFFDVLGSANQIEPDKRWGMFSLVARVPYDCHMVVSGGRVSLMPQKLEKPAMASEALLTYDKAHQALGVFAVNG
ncbi:unnamed protein product [Dibothriocephalus latus]|uniref:Uncharacterized protein n=1 Tax=Dibothriocephalus latus TaxID=60516 RepID=A0A3P6TFU7_DIBLA|nr:unnamed protein product [Dibothriocephalus latus]